MKKISGIFKSYSLMIISIILYSGSYFGLNFVAAFILGVGAVIYGFINPNIEELIMNNYLHGTLFLSIILATLLYLLIFKAKKRSFINHIKFKSIGLKNIIVTVIIGISSFIFVSVGWMMIVSSRLVNLPNVTETIEEYSYIIEPLMNGNIFFVIFIVGIVAPIFEEILFRGIIFNRLNRNINIVIALILQAIIFGAFHMNIIQGIYSTVLGIIIGLTYIYLNSIWAPIIIHVLFNSLNFVLGFLLILAENNFTLSSILVITSLITIIVCLIVLKNNTKNNWKQYHN